ncbi:sporulation protein YqfD [Pelotomaculum sp. PtaB.Bin117]|uniref:sporulation protein YqfD n=1 Tax=Pelotomaculum sp. PtaB.Bin117 TaxID=1811694 RepID=UPI0009C6531C|nr:sporulation protein YqfD [Pelotomaculum sp. PtaB.Bin117]OPX87069.1 MAG: putative stage IV sporulation protein YqfD [Pelotomaculum sp. PtaB.Bin117]
MLLFKIMSYFIGYISILVTGRAPEKFINMAASRGIYLWDILRVSDDAVLLKVRLHDVKPLRHIARRTGCRFHVKSKIGLPFVAGRLKQRKALAFGAAFFLITLYFLSSFVWFIEVRGNEQLTTAEVMDIAAEAGLSRGMPKWRIEPARVETKIMEDLPLVAWTGVYFKGTKVTIEVVERVVPGEKDPRPAHLVAAKAGVIREVLVIDGHPAVKENTTVTPGQILISGEIPPLEETPKPGDNGPPKIIRPARYVHARGIVRARVWYEAYGEARMIETGERLTGRSKKQFSIKYKSKEIILTNNQNAPFEHYQTESDIKRLPKWRNIDVPVELVTVKYLELTAYRDERSRDDARRAAEATALETAENRIPQGAVIQGRWVEEVGSSHSESEGLIRVKAVIETIEDIGIEKLISS